MNKIFGYARVSTIDQNLDTQIDLLEKYGCDKIFQDKIKFAWDNLPTALKATLGPPNADSAGELRFPNGSNIFVSTSVRGGTVQWRDALRHGETGPTLRLTEVDAVVRNVLHRHDWRIDATPEQTVGQRLSLRGQFQQSPGNRPADWRTWSGEAYVDWARVDLAALGAWVPLSENLGLQKGQGALRAWLDVVQGEARNLMLDMSMVDVHAQLGQRLPTLALKHLQGRVGLRRADGVLEVQGQRLVFETQEGERWPGGNWRLRLVGENFQQGSLTAEALDLEALAQVLRRLPLPAPWHTVLAGGEPKGELLGVTLEWQDGAPWRYAAKGRVRGLHWRQLAQAPAPWSRRPRVSAAASRISRSIWPGSTRGRADNATRAPIECAMTCTPRPDWA